MWKSTLVKAVTGLLDKEDGSIDGKIFLDGKDTAAMSAEEIGVLWEQYTKHRTIRFLR